MSDCTISKIRVEPGDSVVIKANAPLCREEYELFRVHAKELYPNNQVVLLDAGVDFGVIKDATARMREIAKDDAYDFERAHKAADELFCETLEKLGFTEAVKMFREMDKCYV